MENVLYFFTEIEEIRKDKNGNDLPNARRITRMLVSTEKKTSKKYSAYLTAFGQFIDHDLTQTPVFKGSNGEFLDCCQLFPLPKVRTKEAFLSSGLISVRFRNLCTRLAPSKVFIKVFTKSNFPVISFKIEFSRHFSTTRYTLDVPPLG